MPPAIIDEVVHLWHQEFAVIFVLPLLIPPALLVLIWIPVALVDRFGLVLGIETVATTWGLKLIYIVTEFLGMPRPHEFLCLAHFLVVIAVL